MSIEAVRHEKAGYFLRKKSEQPRINVREIAINLGPTSITLNPIGYFTFRPLGGLVRAEVYLQGKTTIHVGERKFTKKTGKFNEFTKDESTGQLLRHKPLSLILRNGETIKFNRGRHSLALTYRQGALTSQEEIQRRLNYLLGIQKPKTESKTVDQRQPVSA